MTANHTINKEAATFKFCITTITEKFSRKFVDFKNEGKHTSGRAVAGKRIFQ